jgi:hypothetical protein
MTATTATTSRVLRAAAAAVIVATSMLAAAATAHADNRCADVLGGDWTDHNGVCTASLSSVRDAVMTLSIDIPPGITDDPTAGPLVRDYLHTRADEWRKTGASMVRANGASVDYQVYSHGRVKSVVFHEFQQTVGDTPNDTYRTFTFDLASGRRLQLADLFNSGVDPMTALPPLARPYLSEALDAAPPPHDPGTYPFTTDKFEPQPDGSGYSSNYRAFALTDNELILYLPDAPMTHENPWPQDRFVWSMNGGTVTPHIPLAALAPILQPL